MFLFLSDIANIIDQEPSSVNLIAWFKNKMSAYIKLKKTFPHYTEEILALKESGKWTENTFSSSEITHLYKM